MPARQIGPGGRVFRSGCMTSVDSSISCTEDMSPLIQYGIAEKACWAASSAIGCEISSLARKKLSAIGEHDWVSRPPNPCVQRICSATLCIAAYTGHRVASRRSQGG